MGKVMLNAAAQTLLLLSLWDLDGLDKAVSRSQVIDRVKKKGEKVADYADTIVGLEQMGAIELSGKSNATKLSLKQRGLELLGKGLQSKELQFAGSIMRAKTGNALLRWIGEMGNGTAAPTASNGVSKSNGKVTKIDSYDAFKAIALETFDKLNQDFNLDNLVPIYRIRRTIGDRVARDQFNTWLLKMQSDDILQLLEGTVEDSAPDKIEDSVTNQIGKLRCYAQKLMSQT